MGYPMNSAEQIAFAAANKIDDGIIERESSIENMYSIILGALQEREQAIREPYLKLAEKWRNAAQSEVNSQKVITGVAVAFGLCADEIEGIK